MNTNHLESYSTAVNVSRKKHFYIPSLDGIRAIAFILVFLSHAGYGHIIPGGFGVSIFFFLSGYLITTLMRREYAKHQFISLKKFYQRRILRIWPSFYFVLLLGTLLTFLGFLEGDIQIGPWLGQAFHVINYYLLAFGGDAGIPLGSNIFWSLAVEWHFYTLFPLLYLFLCKKGVSRWSQALAFFAICLVVLLWRCFLVLKLGLSPEYTTYMTDTRIDTILFGCILAVYGNPALDPQSEKSERVLKYQLLPLSTAVLLASLMIRNVEFRETFRYTIQAIALYPWFIASIRFSDWPIFRIVNWKWVKFLGALSYSMYLVHYTVIIATQHYLPDLSVPSQAWVALLISFALAFAIYHLVEQPFAKMRKKTS